MKRCRHAAAIASVLAALAVISLPAPLRAVDEDTTPIGTHDPDFAAGRNAIDRKDWEEAARSFARVALREPENADVHNLLGFSYRQSGRLDLALEEYKRALAIDPRHKGAHEYIGETYLKMGDRASAMQHLEALRKLCPLSCEPLHDLEQELARYDGAGKR